MGFGLVDNKHPLVVYTERCSDNLGDPDLCSVVCHVLPNNNIVCHVYQETQDVAVNKRYIQYRKKGSLVYTALFACAWFVYCPEFSINNIQLAATADLHVYQPDYIVSIFRMVQILHK